MRTITPRMFARAISDDYVEVKLYTLSKPDEIAAYCLTRAGELGFEVRMKPAGSGSNFASVAGGKLWLPASWNIKTPMQRAKVLTHELVHMRQIRQMGAARYSLAYLRPANCWIFEMQGYARGVQTMVRMGCPDEDIEKECARVGKTLRSEYLPVRWFDEQNMLEQTRSALTHVMLAEQSRPRA